MSKSIRVFTTFPKEMFRLNNGNSIRLRGYPGPVKPSRSFDLLTMAGNAQPKALNPQTYDGPNGASMRPNTGAQQDLVRGFRGASIYVYVVPAGTQLPNDLILVHESRDHYSLQPKQEMTVDELNSKITNFLETNGQRLTREEWRQRYPQATEPP